MHGRHFLWVYLGLITLPLIGIAATLNVSAYNTAKGEASGARGHDISQLAFSPDGKTLYGYGDDDHPGRHKNELHAWDASMGKIRWTQQWDGEGGGFQVSPDGKWLVTADRKHYDVRDAKTGVSVRTQVWEDYLPVCFSTDSQQLFVVRPTNITSYELLSGKRSAFWPAAKNKIFKGILPLADNKHALLTEEINDAKDFRRNGTELSLVELATGKTIKSFGLLSRSNPSWSTWSISPDQRHLAINTSKSLEIWQLSIKKQILCRTEESLLKENSLSTESELHLSYPKLKFIDNKNILIGSSRNYCKKIILNIITNKIKTEDLVIIDGPTGKSITAEHESSVAFATEQTWGPESSPRGPLAQITNGTKTIPMDGERGWDYR
jgi:hypothetical protein